MMIFTLSFYCVWTQLLIHIIHLGCGIDPGLPAIRAKRIEVTVEPNLHFVWIGEISDVVVDYLSIWHAKNPTLDISLWTDKRASLANHLERTITSFINTQIDDNPNFETNIASAKIDLRMSVKDQIWAYVKPKISGNLDDINLNSLMLEALNELKFPEAEINSMKQKMHSLESTFQKIPSEMNIVECDINSLFASEPEFFQYYAQELALRQNPAAASDLVRLLVLDEKGGLYLDVDMLPGLNLDRFNELFRKNLLPGEWLDNSINQILLFQAIVQQILSDWHEHVSRLEGREAKVLDRNNPLIPETKKYRDNVAIVASDELKGASLGEAFQRMYQQQANTDYGTFIESWFKAISQVGISVQLKTGSGILGTLKGTYNGVIASIPRSSGIKYMLTVVKAMYRYIDKSDFIRYPESEKDLTEADWEYVVDGAEQNHKESICAYAEEFREKMRTYRTDGYKAASEATIYISGPGAVQRGLRLAENRNDIVIESLLESPFGLFNQYAEENQLSSWVGGSQDAGNNLEVPNNYRYVLRMGETEAEKIAADALVAKGNRRQSTKAVLGLYDGSNPDHPVFRQHSNDAIVVAKYNEIAIAIVGHGDSEKQTISGVSAETLANALLSSFGEDVTVEKISIVACNLDKLPEEGDSGDRFSYKFYKRLQQTHLEPTKHISVRPGLVQVDDLGFKYYAAVDENKPLKWVRSSSEGTTNPTKHLITSEGDQLKTTVHNIEHGQVLNVEYDIKKSGILHSTTAGTTTAVADSFKMMNRRVPDDMKDVFHDIPESGLVITEPSVLAITNAMRDTDHRIVVAGSSARLLEGCRIAMVTLAESPDLAEGIKKLSHLDAEFGENLKKVLTSLATTNEGTLALEHLTSRVNDHSISFVPVDLTSPAAADYLVSLQRKDENLAAYFFGKELNENTVGPATQYQTEQFQKRAIGETLESCLVENAHLVIPTEDGETTHVYRQNERISFIHNLGDVFDHADSGLPQFDVILADMIAADLEESIEQVYRSDQSLEGYVPDLDATEQHQITFRDPESQKRKTISFENNHNPFRRARDILKSKLSSFSKGFRYSKGEMLARPIAEAEPVHTLNAAFFLLAISHIVHPTNRSSPPTPADRAICMQTKLNLVGAAHSVLTDVWSAAKLFQNVYQKSAIQAVASTTRGISGTVGRLGGVFSQAAGVLLNIANVVFDTYELTKSESFAQKSVIGTQLAVDAASLAVTGGAVLAGIAGYGAVAATLGALAVPLAGIGIGLNGLAVAFGRIEIRAENIGLRFYAIDQGFQNVYSINGSTLVPNRWSVIEEINFKTGKVTLGSPMLSKTVHGWSGSGYRGVILWPGHCPKVDRKAKVAINIRERLGYDKVQRLPDVRAVRIVLLPIEPVSTFGSYVWNLSPIHFKYPKGWSVLRKLESGYDFDFDYFIPPWWRILEKIKERYEDTVVKIITDNIRRTFVFPPRKQRETVHYMTYHFVGALDHESTIVLRDNAYLKLEGLACFILDVSQMNASTELKLNEDSKSIVVASRSINVSLLLSESIFVRNDSVKAKYNVKTGVLEEELLEVADATSFSDMDDLQSFLDSEIESHKAQHSIRVSHFLGAGENLVTYDADSHQFVYTENASAPRDERVMMVDGNIAWLTSATWKTVWSIDVTTHKVINNLTLASTFLKDYVGEVVAVKKLGTKWYIRDQISNHNEPKSKTYYSYIFSRNAVQLTSVSLEVEGDAIKESSFEDNALFGWMNDPKYIALPDIIHVTLSSWVEGKVLTPGEHGHANCIARKWTNYKTNNIIKLVAPDDVPGDVLIRLTIIPELSIYKTESKVYTVLLHDQVLKKLYRYTHERRHPSEYRLEVIHSGITQVMQEGDQHIGSTTRGEVIELPLHGNGRLVGYTREGLHFFGKRWWRTMQYNTSYSNQLPLALYGVYIKTPENLQPTMLIRAHVRAWYIPQYKAFAVVDPNKFKNEPVHLLAALNDGLGAIFRTSSGKIMMVDLIHDGGVVFTNDGELLEDADYPLPKEWLPSKKIGKIVESNHIKQSLLVQTDIGIVIGIENPTAESATLALKGLHVTNSHKLRSTLKVAYSMQLDIPVEDFIPTRTNLGVGWYYSLASKDPCYVTASEIHGMPIGTDAYNKKKLWTYDGIHLYYWKYWRSVRWRSTHIRRISRIGSSIVFTIRNTRASIKKEKRYIKWVPTLVGITNVGVVLGVASIFFKPKTHIFIKQLTIVVPYVAKLAKRSKLVISLKPWKEADLSIVYYQNILEVTNSQTGQVVSVMDYFHNPDLIIRAKCEGRSCNILKPATRLNNQYKLLVTAIDFPVCNKHLMPSAEVCPMYRSDREGPLDYSSICSTVCTCESYNASRDQCDHQHPLYAEPDCTLGHPLLLGRCGPIPACAESLMYRNCDPYMEITIEGKPGCTKRSKVFQNVYSYRIDRPIRPICTEDESYMVLDVSDIIQDPEDSDKQFSVTVYHDAEGDPKVLCSFTRRFDSFKQEFSSDNVRWDERVTYSLLDGYCSSELTLVNCFVENKLDVISDKGHDFAGCSQSNGRLSGANSQPDESANEHCSCEMSYSTGNTIETPTCTLSNDPAVIATLQPNVITMPTHGDQTEEICAEATKLYSRSVKVNDQTTANVLFVDSPVPSQSCSKHISKFSLKFRGSITGVDTTCENSVNIGQIKSADKAEYRLSVPQAGDRKDTCTAHLAYHSCYVPHLYHILVVDIIDIKGCERVKYLDRKDNNKVKDSDYCSCRSSRRKRRRVVEIADIQKYSCDVYVEAKMKEPDGSLCLSQSRDD